MYLVEVLTIVNDKIRMYKNGKQKTWDYGDTECSVIGTLWYSFEWIYLIELQIIKQNSSFTYCYFYIYIIGKSY